MIAVAQPPLPKGRPVRLFVVDDSMVIRTLVSSWIEAEPDLQLAGVAADGAEAVRVLAGIEADICVLDLDMPVMGGIEAIPKLLRLRPELKLLIVSRLVQRGPEAGLKAIEAGASDYLAKPSTTDVGGTDAFRRELICRIRTLAQAGVSRPTARAGTIPRPRPLPHGGACEPPELIVVASSTGGPPALRELLCGLGAGVSQPVVIVQHMPAAFIELLAEQLTKASAIPAAVARQGEVLSPGRVWLAPGDRHLKVERKGGQLCAMLDDGPPENFCRPAADVLFRSAAKVCGARTAAVVLTGMGRDGWAGATELAAAGAVIFAQDEESSVVWGMPGAVVGSGLASLVGPVPRLAAGLRRLAEGETP